MSETDEGGVIDIASIPGVFLDEMMTLALVADVIRQGLEEEAIKLGKPYPEQAVVYGALAQTMRDLADVTGLNMGLSRADYARRFVDVHDRAIERMMAVGLRGLTEQEADNMADMLNDMTTKAKRTTGTGQEDA